jgi:hypothetical protein
MEIKEDERMKGRKDGRRLVYKEDVCCRCRSRSKKQKMKPETIAV